MPFLVREAGVEPARRVPLDPKSSASAFGYAEERKALHSCFLSPLSIKSFRYSRRTTYFSQSNLTTTSLYPSTSSSFILSNFWLFFSLSYSLILSLSACKRGKKISPLTTPPGASSLSCLVLVSAVLDKLLLLSSLLLHHLPTVLLSERHF